MKIYRFDLLFSYWIFAWYLLYIFNIINYSPKLELIIGIIENIGLFLFMMFSLHSSNKTILSFIFINILLKVIPLYTIWNDKIYWKKDLCRIIMLFLIYICWSTLLGYNVFTQQMKMIISLRNEVHEHISLQKME